MGMSLEIQLERRFDNPDLWNVNIFIFIGVKHLHQSEDLEDIAIQKHYQHGPFSKEDAKIFAEKLANVLADNIYNNAISLVKATQ
jgi:hypothetical protein